MRVDRETVWYTVAMIAMAAAALALVMHPGVIPWLFDNIAMHKGD